MTTKKKPIQIDKKKIKESVKAGLAEGKSKDQIFEEIYFAQKDPRTQKEIANIVRFVPEKAKLKKYGILNTIFLVLLVLIDIMFLLTLNFGGLLWFGAMTYIVAAKQLKHYYWIMILGGCAFIGGLAAGLMGYMGEGQNVTFILIGSVIFAAIFVAFGIYMPKLLTPNYEIVEETIVDENGESVKRKKIQYN